MSHSRSKAWTAPVLWLAALLLLPGPGSASEHSLAARPGDRLVVGNFAGDVTVTAWERDRIHVAAGHEASDDGIVERRGSRLVVGTSGWDPDAGRFELEEERAVIRLDGESGTPEPISYRIRAPAWLPVSVRGPLTSVRLIGMTGGGEIETLRGVVRLEEVGGDVEVTDLEGRVSVDGGTGRLRITGSDLDVVVRRSACDLEAEVTGGTVELDGASGDRISATTVTGDVLWSGDVAEGREVRLATHSGDVDLRLPPDGGAELELRTLEGALETELGLRLPGDGGGTRRLSTTVGGGGGRLAVDSFRGTIRLGVEDPASEGEDRE